jgi:hypothetical protein
MIRYAGAEAKQNGLPLTGHLLDLADWTLRETQDDATTQPGLPIYGVKSIR